MKKNKDSKITVVVPVYNGETYLKEFMASLENQTFGDYELIFVDDGSTDQSKELIKESIIKDPRIQLLEQKHQGAAFARNLGLVCTKTEFVIFLDCDDWFDSTFLQVMYDEIVKRNADVVLCEFYKYDQESGELAIQYIGNGKEISIEGTNKIFDIVNPSPWNKLYRTSFLTRQGLRFQNISSCNDWCFVYSSLACASRISVINIPLVYYRTNTKQSISSKRHLRRQNIVLAIKELKKELIKRSLFATYEKGFYRRCANSLIFEACQCGKSKFLYVLCNNLFSICDYKLYTFVLKKFFAYFRKKLG